MRKNMFLTAIIMNFAYIIGIAVPIIFRDEIIGRFFDSGFYDN